MAGVRELAADDDDVAHGLLRLGVYRRPWEVLPAPAGTAAAPHTLYDLDSSLYSSGTAGSTTRKPWSTFLIHGSLR
jgi:hypothetical protein